LFEVKPDDPKQRKKKPEEWDVGGLIALDTKGNVAMPFNSEGMYRGTITDRREISIKIYLP
jgi:isoaspartyl peptidase/L-asparaginase-like protein (Ntn-hydrolase superfamily)